MGHKNILKYDKERKFSSLEEHDQYIISEINSLPEDSYLIFLWDLHLTNNDYAEELVSRIKIKNKYWILWNHDSKASVNRLSKYFITVSDDARINESIYLNHFPPVDWQWNTYYSTEWKKKIIHWHSHHPKLGWFVNDISYNGNKLIYNLKELLND